MSDYHELLLANRRLADQLEAAKSRIKELEKELLVLKSQGTKTKKTDEKKRHVAFERQHSQTKGLNLTKSVFISSTPILHFSLGTASKKLNVTSNHERPNIKTNHQLASSSVSQDRNKSMGNIQYEQRTHKVRFMPEAKRQIASSSSLNKNTTLCYSQKNLKEDKEIDRRKTEESSRLSLSNIISQDNYQEQKTQAETAPPLFSHFFVTGLDESGRPVVCYAFPKESSRSLAILSLLHSQDPPIRGQTFHFASQKKMSLVGVNDASKYERDSFVIPLSKSDGSGDREYLVIFEVEDRYAKESRNYSYSRYYCFVTEWKCFYIMGEISKFMFRRAFQILPSSVEGLSNSKLCKFISLEFKKLLQELYTQKLQFGQSLNLNLGNLRIPLTMPASRQLARAEQRRDVPVLKLKIQTSHYGEIHLFGLLLAHLLCDAKIFLYSSSKAKVSQVTIESLDALLPLEYVNPIILSIKRNNHEEYLTAPMPLFLGLWSDANRSPIKRTENFMSESAVRGAVSSLQTQIDNNQVRISDGIFINLDTCLTSGENLQQQIMNIAEALNTLFIELQHSRHEQSHIIDNMLARKHTNYINLWRLCEARLLQTQMYSFYIQKRIKLRRQ